MRRLWVGFIFFLTFFAQAMHAGENPHTVILVHGAFADGSSWSKVIPLLQEKGINVVAVQNPLTSLADDVATVKRAIEKENGTITLVGHSWGGVVITEAGNSDKVSSLVYVAAFAPGDSQSAFDLVQDYPISPALSKMQADAQGYQSLSAEAFAHDFAQDLPYAETQILYATQGPIASQCLTDKVSEAAWSTKKTWFIIAEQDRVIPPELQKDVATKMKATITSLPSSHVPMLSQPEAVVKVILSAIEK